MNRAAETRHLNTLRQRWALLDGASLLLGADDEGEFLDAKGRDGSLVTVLRFTGQATPDERDCVAHALDDVRFLLMLLDRAIKALRPARPAQEQREAVKDHATEVAMLCESPAFKRFLMEEHGLESPATKDRTAQKLRSLLSITSRKDLNNDDGARERWFALRAKFNIWKGRAMS